MPIVESSSGCNGWARVKRDRTKSSKRLLPTTVFDSGHLQHECERPDMERKYLNNNKAQHIDPKLTTIFSEMCGTTNIQSSQACILQYYKSQSKTLSPTHHWFSYFARQPRTLCRVKYLAHSACHYCESWREYAFNGMPRPLVTYSMMMEGVRF